jgi:ABC-type arginine transport system ATPase subunit
MTMATPLPPGAYHWTWLKTAGHPLKNFLAWRRRYHPRVAFSFAHGETTLHPDFSVTDNILMAAKETLTADALQRTQLAKTLLEKAQLLPLLAWLPLSAVAMELTPVEKNLAALICALVTPTQAVLWDARGAEFNEVITKQLQRLLSDAPVFVVVITEDGNVWKEKSQGEFRLTVADPKRQAARTSPHSLS